MYDILGKKEVCGNQLIPERSIMITHFLTREITIHTPVEPFLLDFLRGVISNSLIHYGFILI